MTLSEVAYIALTIHLPALEQWYGYLQLKYVVIACSSNNTHHNKA